MGKTGLLQRFPALASLGRSRRTIPHIPQTTSADCGAACLTMVLDYHGKKLALEEVRHVAGVDRDGSDALALAEAGRWFGLRSRGVQVEEIDDLRLLPEGSILHWRFQHFVVFEKITPRGARIVDPATGRREVSHNELRQAVTGVALTFEPRAGFIDEGDERPSGLARYLREIFQHSRSLSRLLVLSVLLQILALATPLLTGTLVDRVVPRGDVSLLQLLTAGLAMVVGFHFLASLVRSYLMLHLRTHLDAKITLEFLEHLVDLPYAYFQQRSTGDLMMRLSSNTTIREILTSGALSGILDGVLVSLYLLLMLLTHVQLAMVVLGLGLVRISLFLLTRRRQQELMSQTLEAEARSRSYQVQILNGIETLKAVGAEGRAVESWSNLFVDELNVSLARGRLNAWFDSLMSALTTASPFIVLLFGGHLVLRGDLTLGTMLALAALATGFLTPLSSLVQTAVQLQFLRSYLERINDVMETAKEQDKSAVGPAHTLRGNVALEAVSFRYGPLAPEVVRDVSLAVEPGQLVALVGPSGAGKTTLMSLLSGLYQPTGGRVLFDSVDLNSLDLRTVRLQLGIVSQQSYLFGGSIRSNLSLGDPSLPLPRLVEAAKRAQIHDDIVRMPMGYDTIVADGGTSLSGGQHQRLALARALVHRPAILLLDEATSHLDALNERAIQEQLAALKMTRIVIAHRLSTVQGADLILVMAGGRIVQRGRHQELVAGEGLYRQLFQAQLDGERGPAA